MRRELETIKHYLNKTHDGGDCCLEVHDAIEFLDQQIARLDDLEFKFNVLLSHHKGIKMKLEGK